jgi:hypothetical protein
MCYVERYDCSIEQICLSWVSNERVTVNFGQGELKEDDMVHRLFNDMEIGE